MTAARIALLAVVLVALVSACGSSGGGPSTSTSTSSTTPIDGRQAFILAACGSCHALKAAGTHGIVGRALDGLRLSTAQIAERIRNGDSGMPSYEKTLSPARIAAIAAFVNDAAKG